MSKNTQKSHISKFFINLLLLASLTQVAALIFYVILIQFTPLAQIANLSSLTAHAATFSDVPTSETYKSAIDFLSDMGIIQGHADAKPAKDLSTFKPLDTLNRAEMLKIIAEASIKYHKSDTKIFDSYTTQNCFTDVRPRSWYTKYVCYGKANGWVTGYDNATPAGGVGKNFKPNLKVNFVEALKMSYKAFGLSYDEKSNPWFKDLVAKSSQKNYIPHTISTFGQFLQRNQMADLITRIIKYDLGETEFNTYLGTRTDIVVNYDTLEKGQDLSKLEVKTLTP